MPPVSGDLATTIQQAWAGFLELVAKVVSPDWGALIALIPLLIAPVVALYVLAMLGRWTVFWLLKPRPKVRHVEGARAMERDADGRLALELKGMAERYDYDSILARLGEE